MEKKNENEENSLSNIALCFQNVSDPISYIPSLWTFQFLPSSGQEFSLVLTLDYSEAQANGLWNWPTWNKYVSLFITA